MKYTLWLYDYNNMKLLQLVCLLLDHTFHLLLLDYTFHPKFAIFNLSLITSTCLMLNNLPHLLVWMYDVSLLCKLFWYQSFRMCHSFRILGFTAHEMQLPRVPSTPKALPNYKWLGSRNLQAILTNPNPS